jgi:hypothetical protein
MQDAPYLSDLVHPNRRGMSRVFDEAMDSVEDGLEGVTGDRVEGALEHSDTSGGIKPNDAMPDEPPHAISPQRCDRQEILCMAAFFLVAFAGGAVVGLMLHVKDAESSSATQALVTGGTDDFSGGDVATNETLAADTNEPPTGLLRSTRSPSPSQSLQPTNEPADTSGAWYSIQSNPSSTEEGTTLQSSSTSISSETGESTIIQSNSTSIPSQNGSMAPNSTSIPSQNVSMAPNSTSIPSQNGSIAPTGNNDTSTSSIVNTQPSNSPAPTPLTIDVSSWIDAFDSLPIVQEMVTSTTSTMMTSTATTTTQGTATTDSSINLGNWVDAFNAITMAEGAAPCLTEEACDAKRQSMGFTDYEVGD